MECLASQGAPINNPVPQGATFRKTIGVVKWEEEEDFSGDDIYAPLYVGIYKEGGGSIYPWSGIYTYSKINFLTWSKKGNYCIVTGDV